MSAAMRFPPHRARTIHPYHMAITRVLPHASLDIAPDYSTADKLHDKPTLTIEFPVLERNPNPPLNHACLMIWIMLTSTVEYLIGRRPPVPTSLY